MQQQQKKQYGFQTIQQLFSQRASTLSASPEKKHGILPGKLGIVDNFSIMKPTEKTGQYSIRENDGKKALVWMTTSKWTKTIPNKETGVRKPYKYMSLSQGKKIFQNIGIPSDKIHYIVQIKSLVDAFSRQKSKYGIKEHIGFAVYLNDLPENFRLLVQHQLKPIDKSGMIVYKQDYQREDPQTIGMVS